MNGVGDSLVRVTPLLDVWRLDLRREPAADRLATGTIEDDGGVMRVEKEMNNDL